MLQKIPERILEKKKNHSFHKILSAILEIN